MDPELLKTELMKPVYVSLTLAQKVAALQAKTVTPIDGTGVSVTREQIRMTFVPAEFIALIAQKQNTLLAVLQSDRVYVEGADANLIATAFAGQTGTLANLIALRDSAIAAASQSPADLIGFGGLTDDLLTDWINKVSA